MAAGPVAVINQDAQNGGKCKWQYITQIKKKKERDAVMDDQKEPVDSFKAEHQPS